MTLTASSPNPSVGQSIHGFTVKRITPLKNLRSTAIELEHRKTGARLLHVHNEDAENLFSVTFPTPPPDDTGLPHILEHAVLGGSKRFPVKDPFFEMVKMSMATFINAMTDSDNTIYPVASNVRQDFFNLAEVYFDAVFHPELTENTFKREGHHYEFAKSGDLSSDLIVKGIVYNEMKGAYSSPDSRVHDHISRLLFPDTIYGKDSGGNPDVIPTLTYENFIKFHQTFYHPSNAYFFMYGDISTVDHLQFLEEKLAAFDRKPVDTGFTRQPRWTQPRQATDVYPVGPKDETAKKSYIVLNWLVGEHTDVQEMLAFSVIQQVLLGHQGAPLRKAIIDSKLGEDLSHSFYSAGRLESSFHIGIKGSEPERADAFQRLVIETLTRIADEGIDGKDVDAAFQQLAYRYLEIASSYPLWLMDRSVSLWIYGADPLILLRADELMKELRARYEKDPNLFGRIIREKVLDNPHRLLLSVVPDPGYQIRKDEEFAESMRHTKASLSPQRLKQISDEADELERLLNTPNSPEALGSLPQLKVKDLPPKPKHIPTKVHKLAGGMELLRNDVFANGVNYLHVALDIGAMPTELYSYLRLYGDCIHKMGAAGLNYVQMAQRVAANTGGIGFGAGVNTHVADPHRSVRSATFTLRFLDENVEEALAVLRDFLFELDPNDNARLKDVLLQARASDRTQIVNNGLSLAQTHASRGLTPESRLGEIMRGLPQVRLVESLAEQGDREPLMQKIAAVRHFLNEQAHPTASFTGTDRVFDVVAKTLEGWSSRLSKTHSVESPMSPPPPGKPPRDGLAGPMNVAFCTTVLPAPHLSHPDAGLLSVGGRLVGMGYVLEEVRFKGTAYGGGCGYNGLGQSWGFHSYRDPWVKRTLDVFRGAMDYVKNIDWSQTDVDRAIIGTAKEGERPIRPAEATGAALWRHLSGDTPQRREARHAAILRATPGEVKRAVLEVLNDANFDRAGVCVVSSREKLENANREMPEATLAIEDVLKQ